MNKLDKHLEQIQQELVVTSTTLAALSAASLVMAATRLYKDYFTKAARQCSDLAPNEKSMCMLRTKMLAKNVMLQKLKSSMAKCKKAKDQKKCEEKLSGKMQKVAAEIKYLGERFKDLKSKSAK